MRTTRQGHGRADHPHALTGVYVCDALGARERRDVERHLRACQSCADEVAELRAVAAALGAALGVNPPVRLWLTLRARVAATRQLSALNPGIAEILARLRRCVGHHGSR
jgi:anti-sigma-K factor RskA